MWVGEYLLLFFWWAPHTHTHLFFKKQYYNTVKVTSHLHEINKLGSISPLENVNLFPDYQCWLRKKVLWKK